jgi:hypothetical protein
MGRTLTPISMELREQEAVFSRFRRALRRSDQLVLDDLFSAASKHVAEAAYAANAMPMETFLLAMLLEEHKEVMHLRTVVEAAMTQISYVAHPALPVGANITEQP